MTLESDIQTDCLNAVAGRSDIWVLNVHGNAVQRGGVPDILLCVRGRFAAVELKRPDGSYGLRGRQRVHLRLIRAAGGYGAVVRSVEEFLTFIDSIPPTS